MFKQIKRALVAGALLLGLTGTACAQSIGNQGGGGTTNGNGGGGGLTLPLTANTNAGNNTFTFTELPGANANGQPIIYGQGITVNLAGGLLNSNTNTLLPFASIPACVGSGSTGYIASDASVCVAGEDVVGGGTIECPLICNAGVYVAMGGGGGGGGGSGYPNGSPPQIAAYGATNSAEAETVSGDCTFARPSANSYVLTCIGSNGVPFGTAAFDNTGASGHTIPFLDIANTWSAQQNLSGAGLTSGTVPETALANSTVTPGAYTNANITVSQQGLVTAAASGSSGSGFPAGGPPQVGGFSATNTPEAETFGGDATLTRTGPNAYKLVVIASNGVGFGTAAFQFIGTSGANVPLMSTANTWTLAQTFTVAPIMSGASISAGTIPDTALHSNVTAGSCTNCNTTYNAQGIATAFSNGSGGGGGTYPSGGPPQFAGFSAANTPEAETISGPVTFFRSGTNAYESVLQFTGSIVQNCTNTSADEGLLHAALTSGNYVVYTHGPCDITSALSYTANAVSLISDYAPWSCASAATPCLTVTTGGASYQSGSGGFVENLNMVGPGATTSTVGLQVNGNFLNFINPRIDNFGTEVQIGNNGFIDVFTDAYLYGGNAAGNGTMFNCPSGLSNAGEGIQFNGGAWFNSAHGFLDSGCELKLMNVQLDDMIIDAGEITAGVSAQLTDVHVEYVGSAVPTSGHIFSITGANAFTSLIINDSWLEVDSFVPTVPISFTNTSGSPATQSPYVAINQTRGIGITWPSGQANWGGQTLAPIITGVNLCGDTTLNGGGVYGDITPVGTCLGSLNGCKQDITLSSGSGIFSNTCVLSTSSCDAKDLQTPADVLHIAAPTTGSVGITGGTGSDTARVWCQL